MVVADQTPTKKVASMSVGGSFNPFVDQGIEDAVKAGVVVSVAAGNSNADACNYSPSAAPSVSSCNSSYLLTYSFIEFLPAFPCSSICCEPLSGSCGKCHDAHMQRHNCISVRIVVVPE